ncbi:MAG: acyl-CoA thioesterase [Synechococcus sp. SB0668_bin_15]|nr:acyl-CoA thioesterase [Synechococcus sp. SB0668_bin_15]MYC48991.1 acyl-CoA thioesterase [Synechococcus sp. SB0662_bin_14]
MTIEAPPPYPPWLVIRRTVRFGETDPAGVVHFHHLLRWCHEAYEESLNRFGVATEDVFANPHAALPITHCQARYHRPMGHGDVLLIRLACRQLDPTSFEIHYDVHNNQQVVATGLTRHLCIHPVTRQRQALPTAVGRWLEAATAHQGISTFRVNTPDLSSPDS